MTIKTYEELCESAANTQRLVAVRQAKKALTEETEAGKRQFGFYGIGFTGEDADILAAHIAIAMAEIEQTLAIKLVAQFPLLDLGKQMAGQSTPSGKLN